MSGLKLTDLTVRYGDLFAVNGASLKVEPGKVLGLVGESGSGKSTLARAVVGLAPISGGTIEIGGERIDNARKRQRRRAMRRVQMIFQDPKSALDPRFTVAQCIEEALVKGKPTMGRPSRRLTVKNLLEQVALDPDVARLKPGKLSGGQQQRVAIARALAASPEVLIADEVTASLDVSVQAVILNLLRNIQNDTGLAMVFISHNLAVVRYMAHDIAVMYRGDIVENTSTTELVSNPQHPYSKTLLAAVPRLGETLAAAPTCLGGGRKRSAAEIV